jgi:hypothetical protein
LEIIAIIDVIDDVNYEYADILVHKNVNTYSQMNTYCTYVHKYTYQFTNIIIIELNINCFHILTYYHWWYSENDCIQCQPLPDYFVSTAVA